MSLEVEFVFIITWDLFLVVLIFFSYMKNRLKKIHTSQQLMDETDKNWMVVASMRTNKTKHKSS